MDVLQLEQFKNCVVSCNVFFLFASFVSYMNLNNLLTSGFRAEQQNIFL